MIREYLRWRSPALQRDMEMLVFGEAGAKVFLFPTREGRFFEYENIGLVRALSDKIIGGHLQLFCLEALASEIFYSHGIDTAEKIRRYKCFEEYVIGEVVPFAANINSHPEMVASGCSLGAFYAANMTFRHPETFTRLVAFSGRYDLTIGIDEFAPLLGGIYDDEVYFNTPNHFLRNLNDPLRIQALRRIDMIFVIGNQDPFLENNRYLSSILQDKGIGHQLHEWQGRAHQGRFWRQMAQLYL